MTSVRATLLRRLAVVCAGAALAGAALAADIDRPPTWASLTAQEKQSLAPLQRDWSSIDASRKKKWLEVASRFPKMSSDERARIQERMAEWARMSPAERAQARLQFQEAQQIPAGERQSKWEAYQALTPEERRTLEQRAKPAVRSTAPSASAAPVADGAAGKRNTVPPVSAPTVRAVTPTIVQAKPGATTTPITAKVAPPAHQQPGMPKIAATPGFVDPATLLPKRGPQAAVVRTAAASEPAAQP